MARMFLAPCLSYGEWSLEVNLIVMTGGKGEGERHVGACSHEGRHF